MSAQSSEISDFSHKKNIAVSDLDNPSYCL